MDNIFGVRIVFSKDKCFGDNTSVWKEIREKVILKSLDHCPNLVHGDNISVQLSFGIFDIGIEFIPMDLSVLPIPSLDIIPCINMATALCNFSIDSVDVIANVHIVRDSLFVAVFIDEIVIKKSDSLSIRRCG